MKTITKWGMRLLILLLGIGVIRGVIRHQQETGSTGIEGLLTAIVDGVADVTYRWLPALIEMLTTILGG